MTEHEHNFFCSLHSCKVFGPWEEKTIDLKARGIEVYDLPEDNE